MPFDWKEYLELARFLQARSGDGFTEEAASRSGVSRAYYAAFCCARNHARDNLNFAPGYDADDHWRVRQHFRQRREMKIVDELGFLIGWRTACDYEDVIGNHAMMADQAVKSAEKVLADLESGGSTA